ncbi:hypothetical protein LT85_2965 [Collimonas arenae]|uniref:Uncharacterized protein n=1 Tax=Collimonas arenae TaxID=279058 RepID=A0A0A1FBK3_9BURK|nr:hypothetical protein LT85_2965 [Collimonas arenae]
MDVLRLGKHDNGGSLALGFAAILFLKFDCVKPDAPPQD